MNEILSDKHIRMYLKHARTAADPEHNSCLSRSIGAALVKLDKPGGRIINTGYNGPASSLPRCDSHEHLLNVVLPQLSDDEYADLHRRACEKSLTSYSERSLTDRQYSGFVAKQHSDCSICPRHLIGAKSGDRLELCSCAHAERNAIERSTEDLDGCWILCWCPLPCHECSIAIIQSGIKCVVCLSMHDYSKSSRWMLIRAGVDIIECDEGTLDITGRYGPSYS